VEIGTQKDLTKPDATTQQILKVLAMASNSLYNTGVYVNRQRYFKEKRFVGYSKLCSDLKVDENYKIMHSQAGQQTLKSVAESFSSFRELERMFKNGELKEKPRLPHYRTKGGLYQIVYPGQALKVIEDKDRRWIQIPLGRAGKAFFEGIDSITLPYPQRLWDKQIKELRFIPSHGTWYTEYVYEISPQVQATGSNALGIDPGLNNWVSAVCTNGKSFLISGKRLKSVNQYYNKTKAALQGAVDKYLGESGFFTKRMQRLTDKRNRQMRNAVNVVAKTIINWCLGNSVNTVVFGCNKEQKQGIDIGSRNNQNFVQIPTAKLRKRVEQLCILHGINFVEAEEAYTSKASFLDEDLVPAFGEKPEGYEFSGTRVKRGLFRTSAGFEVNADLNGAGNILRKVAVRMGLDLSQISRGCLTHPWRLYA
jgi:IS605 OrfB family transposase